MKNCERNYLFELRKNQTEEIEKKVQNQVTSTFKRRILHCVRKIKQKTAKKGKEFEVD